MTRKGPIERERGGETMKLAEAEWISMLFICVFRCALPMV